MRKTVKVVNELVINKVTAAQYWEKEQAGELRDDQCYLVYPDKATKDPADLSAYLRKEEAQTLYQPKGEYATKADLDAGLGDIETVLNGINGGAA